MVVLPAVASMIAGCADSRMAANNADAQPSRPYQTGYGMSSSGPTTNLYSEMFGSDAPATASSAPPPQGQTVATANMPAAAPGTVQHGQPMTAAGAIPPPGQPAMASAAPPEPPPPPAAPAAYGISSNGPTTNLYNEIFGAGSHN
jgi:hypothetical protein